MIKLTLAELVGAEPIFAKLDKLSKEGNLVFKVTYQLTKLIKKIQPELQDYYAEKQKLLEKFGKEIKDEEDKSTGQYKIENTEEFMKYMQELLSVELELSNVFPFKTEDLESVKGLSVEDIAGFGKFIEDEPKEEEKERKAIKLNIE